MNIADTFIERKGEWGTALFQHLQISLLSLLIAIIIAVPLGIILSNNKKISEWFLQITGVFQTIPSLALLGLFIPFMGIGTVPAVVALVIYALFPILQSTLTGLSEIDSSLEEAATAFGMTKWEKLKKYQLALSMPILMGGVRTASIMIIGTATLAALIGAGGLGSFILLGIDRNNSALILIGAISSAVLAIIFGALIKFLQNKKPKTIVVTLLSAVVAVTLSFTPLAKTSNDKLVIAGKLGAEPEILINMYKILIENETDINVEVKPNFGKTSFLYEALKGGSIDIYPEFTGTVTTTLLKEPVTNISNNPREVYEIAKEKILAQDRLVYLEPSEFQLEFNDREDGVLGLKKLYGLNLNIKTMEPALRYQAIANGDVNIIEVFSTDSKLITNKLKVLEDDKKLFPPYQGAPLLREETLKKYPQLEKILGKLAGKITTEEMTKMNYAVDVEGKSAYEVAKAYLQKEGLIKK